MATTRKPTGIRRQPKLTDSELDAMRRILAAGGTVKFELSRGRANSYRIHPATAHDLEADGFIEKHPVPPPPNRRKRIAYRIYTTAAGSKAYAANLDLRSLRSR